MNDAKFRTTTKIPQNDAAGKWYCYNLYNVFFKSSQYVLVTESAGVELKGWVRLWHKCWIVWVWIESATVTRIYSSSIFVNLQNLCRNTFDRVVTLAISSKKIKSFFKRFVDFETKHGSESSVSAVRQKTLNYIESQAARLMDDWQPGLTWVLW